MSDILQASGSRLPATGRSQATLSQALAGPEARGLWPGAFVDEPGIALIVVLMAMMLIAALGSALVLVTVTETRISANVRDGAEARHVADGAVERVMQELPAISNWNAILTGAATSAFVDGPASGQRTLEDGTRIDLTQETNLVRCAKTTACSDADMDAVTAERPWGANNPRWQLYAYGPMRRMLPNASIDSRTYVAVWLADDSSENDNRPLEDGATDMNPGRGVLAMLVHAYGPGGALAMIEVTVARIVKTDPQRGARILSWREVR